MRKIDRMKALTYDGPYRVKIRNKPEPQIEHPQDGIVRVRTAAICGSDLHLLHGLIPDTRIGSTLGHEFTGTVEELGATGPALGIVPEGAWGLVAEEGLGRGDTLLLYTDGATEAVGPERERFGLARLRRHFAEAAALSPTRVLERLEDAVDAWGSRADDCSMLVARIR